jgi:membrane protease YdiL (CAAX protease family)
MSFDSVLEKLKSEKEALSSILIIVGVLLLAMVLGNILAAIAMILIGGVGLNDMADINGVLMSSSDGWWALMIGQGIAAVFTFIGAGVFYWKLVEKQPLSRLNFRELSSAKIFLLVIITQLCFIPFNSWFQEINETMKLPDFLSGLETMMREMENSLARTLEYLAEFNSFPKFLIGFIVMAIIAGIGEELIFRGLIQRKLYKGLKNPHAAIWLAAFIFSAIHFQFYGFLPRLFLGALFGYFYYWSGNLWVPIVGHIFHNGLIVIMYRLITIGVLDKDVAEMETFPPVVIAISFVLTVGMIWLFRKEAVK